MGLATKLDSLMPMSSCRWSHSCSRCDLALICPNLSLFILFCWFVFAVFECFRVFWVVTCCNYMKSICNYGVITSYHVLSTLVLGPWPLWLRTQIQCVLATPGCQGLPRLRARRSTMPSACTIQQVPREPYRPGMNVFFPCFSHWLQLWTALPKILCDISYWIEW